jgi:hypothetical protein
MCDNEQTCAQRLRTLSPGARISCAARSESMLRTMEDLEDYSIGATDGSIGRVKDFYFDDERWIVRYFVVETGAWLANRRVLISTMSIHAPNWLNRLLPVSMAREQIEESPVIDTGRLAGHDDHHLRSCKTVVSSHIRAPDGDVGHVCGFLIDEENWAIRYLIVDTRNWWLGHQVLIAPEWIEGMSWDDHTVSVKLTLTALRNAPPYRAKTQFDRDAETKLHDHYGLPGYWAGKVKLQNSEFRHGA